MSERQKIEEAVRQHYAAAVRSIDTGSDDRRVGSCTGEAGIGSGCYEAGDVEDVPAAAVASSIGCANPVAVADLAPGEVVLDLGSGGGLDVLLSARRVGRTGRAYGLDMTDEMLELARGNQARAGVENVEFLKGHVEAIPLPDASVDVVLSNCVIALSADKDAVFLEAHRVLRPNGRLAVADVLAEGDLNADQETDVASWITCARGALAEPRYRAALEAAGFVGITVERRHPVGSGLVSAVAKASKAG